MVFWLAMVTVLEKKPSNFEKIPFVDREEDILLKNGTTYYGNLAIDLFQCEKLLLPSTKVRLKLIRARSNFYIISYHLHVSVKILTCSLFTRRVVVNGVYHKTIKYQLTHQTACYNFTETIARTFIILSGQNHFMQENVFNNAPIRTIAFAINRNSAFIGHFQENPFHNHKFVLRELTNVRGGRAIVSFDTTMTVGHM